MPSFTIGIVAHTTRAAQAHTLMENVGAAFMSIDDGTYGCAENHTRVWERLARADTEWVAVLEDDAIPVDGFRDQLEQALSTAAAPIVSLYLGTSRPPQWQHFITPAVDRANHEDASWLTAPYLFHNVAVAVKTELAPVMADWCVNLNQTHDADEPIADHTIAYTWPSLVDHRDDTPVVLHPDGQTRDRPRVAHRKGTRTTWTTRTVEII